MLRRSVSPLRGFVAVGAALGANACAVETVDSGPEFVPQIDEAVVEAPLPAASWDAVGAAEVLNTTLALGLPDPTGVFSAYQAMWAGADDMCPTSLGEWNITMYVASCHSQAGWTYAGITEYTPGDGDDFFLLADGYIVDPAGVQFTLAGEIERESTDEGWATKMTGTWQYPASTTAWLAQAQGIALWTSLDFDGVHLDGGVGMNDVDLNFAGVTVGPDCATGVVWLRDPGGAWYTVDLGEDCDRCGEVEYGGDAFGEACLDLDKAVQGLAQRME